MNDIDFFVWMEKTFGKQFMEWMDNLEGGDFRAIAKAFKTVYIKVQPQ